MILKKMDINFELIIEEMRKLQRYADDITEIRSSLILHKELLNNTWLSIEIEGINDAIDEMNRRAQKIIDELFKIGYDMHKAYEEIE